MVFLYLYKNEPQTLYNNSISIRGDECTSFIHVCMYVCMYVCTMVDYLYLRNPFYPSRAIHFPRRPFHQSKIIFIAISGGPSTKSLPSRLNFHSFIPCKTPAEAPAKNERTKYKVVCKIPGMVAADS